MARTPSGPPTGRGATGTGFGFSKIEAGFALYNLYMHRKENPDESWKMSLLKQGGSMLLTRALPGVHTAQMIGQGLAFAGKVGMESAMQQPYQTANLSTAFASASFADTDIKATMRQRSMQAIQNSRMNARSVLGSEARMLHTGSNLY